MRQTTGNRLREVVQKAAGDTDVLAVIAFGSHARGDAGPASDVDVCLVLQPKRRTPLALSLKKMKYLKAFDLDIQVFQQLPLYIRTRVLRDGKVLFCRDENGLYDLAFRTAQEFEDFKPVYYGYLEEVARG